MKINLNWLWVEGANRSAPSINRLKGGAGMPRGGASEKVLRLIARSSSWGMQILL